MGRADKLIESYSIDKDKNCIFIQLKFNWGNLVKEKIKKKIQSDEKTLSKIESEHKYIIYWEYNNIKDKNEIKLEDIKNKFKVNVIYINGLKNKVYCNSKGLQDKIHLIKNY